LFQGRFTAQFFNFLLLFIFPQAVCFDIVTDYCITSQENESRLLIVTNITIMYCDLNWLKWLDLKMTANEMGVWLHIVSLQKLDIDVESRLDVMFQNLDLDSESGLDVMLHRFLFSQAESPKGSKTQAHSSPFQALERATG